MSSTISSLEPPENLQSQRIPSIGHVQVFQRMLFEKSLCPGDKVIDATLGNGNDSLLLLEIIEAKGFLYGFDIQSEAVDSTTARLRASNISNFQLFCQSHEHMDQFVKAPVQGIVFNLGYLPSGNKSCTTVWESTQAAINKGMELLLPNGFISVMTYPGHESGCEEDEALQGYFSKIDQKKFQIAQIQFLNQKNNPPKLYWLTKRT